jgi:hypothetical protein
VIAGVRQLEQREQANGVPGTHTDLRKKFSKVAPKWQKVKRQTAGMVPGRR